MSSHVRRILFLLLVLAGTNSPRAFSAEIRDADVVAFVGGGDVSASQYTGHLESLLAADHPTAHFRNYGWEGDTVFDQPRDVGFPPLKSHLQRARASLIFIQFGRTESLQGPGKLQAFGLAYKKLLADLRPISARLVLVTPPPFETAPEPLLNLATHNSDLAAYVELIRQIAQEEHLDLVDLFSELSRSATSRLTDDGLQITPRGHALVALAFARHLGLSGEKAGAPSSSGAWSNPDFESLRKAIVAKNRPWFNYWRPQNWAFLGGDRTEQPSSRDYRDPKIRWFPTEIEKFNDLIAARETEITALASKIK